MRLSIEVKEIQVNNKSLAEDANYLNKIKGYCYDCKDAEKVIHKMYENQKAINDVIKNLRSVIKTGLPIEVISMILDVEWKRVKTKWENSIDVEVNLVNLSVTDSSTLTYYVFNSLDEARESLIRLVEVCNEEHIMKSTRSKLLN